MKYLYTNVFGDAYIPYLKSLLNSIERFYSNDLVFKVVYDNISDWEISILKKTYPNVDFISDEIILIESKSIHHLIANKSKGWSNFVSTLNDGDKVIFLDVDTNVLKNDLWAVFDDCNFDLSLTTFTSGYKLNTGVIFLTVNAKSKLLFQRWSDQVFEIFLSYSTEEIEVINKQFGAVDQFVFCKLAEIHQSRSINDLYPVELDNGNFVNIKLLDGNIYNLINSNNWSFSTKVIHFKSGWRNILNRKSFFNLSRRYKISSMQYGIWYDNYIDSIHREMDVISNENLVTNNFFTELEKIDFSLTCRDLISILNLSCERPILIDLSFNLRKYYFFDILNYYFIFLISYVHKRSALIKKSQKGDVIVSHFIILPFLQRPSKKYYFIFIFLIIYFYSHGFAFLRLVLYFFKSSILKLFFFLKNER